MINTSDIRLEKIAWFKNCELMQNETHLTIQKFLFFYEMFSKVLGKQTDLDYLRAYPNGPVFSNTYGDITYRSSEFENKVNSIKDFPNVDEDIARAASSLVKTFTDTELSEFTHQFDLWKSKEDLIDKQRNISIDEEDITSKDLKKFELLYEEYSEFSNQDYVTFQLLDKIFIIESQDYDMLSEEHRQIIEILSNDSTLENPVYLELEEGVLLID